MEWAPNIAKGDEPMFMALVRTLADDISAGRLVAGSRLPTQRELADELKIAIGTVTRAFREAERRGLIYGDGRRGTFVGEMPRGRRLLSIMSSVASAGIDLSKNHPAHSLDPNLGRTLRQIARNPECQHLLLYPPPAGLMHHRQAGAEWIRSLGLQADFNSVFLTSGAQHALMVIFAAETHPGDLVATEEYTYPGVKAVAETLGLGVVGIPMDDEGIIPDALEYNCRHKNPRLLYCNPSLQNPTNRIFSSSRKKQIAAIVEKYNLIIVEDEILSPLLDETPDFISGMAPENSYFVVSTSKAIAAGLRLGFIVAPSDSRQRLIDSLQTSNLGGPPLMAEIFAHWLREGILEQTISKRRHELAILYQIASEILKDFVIRAQKSSYHVWLELPESWTGAALATEAQSRGVMVAPGEIFAADKKASVKAVRLSIGAITDREYLKRGLCILRDILTGPALKNPVRV